MPSYRLKVERAKRHIRELAAEIEAFNARKPYSIYTENDASAGQRFWKVRIRECVPQEWSGIVGDAIHNARASLDLLMVAVVRHCDPTRVSYNHVKFIVGETKDKFEARLRDAIKGASPQARRCVEDLKPYKGGDEAFWRLHQLDILDKHKAIIPVGAAYRSFGITFDGRKLFPDAFPDIERAPPRTVFFNSGDRQFPLKDGAALFAAPINGEFPFDDDVKFAFEVSFGEGQIIDGEPVIPALTQICQFVEGVFEVFEKRILKT